MESEYINSTEDAIAATATTVNTSDMDGMEPDAVPAGCFEFRLRTRSFDMHQLAHGSKLKKFGRMFRTSSDGGVKHTSSVPSSPAGGSSPHHSPPRRRRFVRVVRDKPEDCTEDGRYVVHKYSEAFLARANRERHSSESEYGDRPLPYEVTGHTILKRTPLSHSQSISSNNNSLTGGGDGETTPAVFKHASFRSEVVVIEFDTKCKVREAPATHVVPLHDAIVGDYDSHAACQRFEDFAETETIAALTKDLLSSDSARESSVMQPQLAASTNGVSAEPVLVASDGQ